MSLTIRGCHVNIQMVHGNLSTHREEQRKQQVLTDSSVVDVVVSSDHSEIQWRYIHFLLD